MLRLWDGPGGGAQVTAPLNPKQFGQFMDPDRIKSRAFVSANFLGGHVNEGYGAYDHLATEPLSKEVAMAVAKSRGADSPN